MTLVIGVRGAGVAPEPTRAAGKENMLALTSLTIRRSPQRVAVGSRIACAERATREAESPLMAGPTDPLA